MKYAPLRIGGWNVLVGADKYNILAAVMADVWTSADNTIFGKGDAAEKIVRAMEMYRKYNSAIFF